MWIKVRFRVDLFERRAETTVDLASGEEIGEQIYKRWWTMPNRDAYIGSMMREIAREAFEVGRQAGRENAARDIERHCPDPVWHGVCAHKAMARIARMGWSEDSDQPRTPAQREQGDNPEEQR